MTIRMVQLIKGEKLRTSNVFDNLFSNQTKGNMPPPCKKRELTSPVLTVSMKGKSVVFQGEAGEKWEKKKTRY